MKSYTMSAAQSFSHIPVNPERTAKRNVGTGLNFDVVFQIWPSRESMLKTIQMQEKRAPHWSDWKACKS